MPLSRAKVLRRCGAVVLVGALTVVLPGSAWSESAMGAPVFGPMPLGGLGEALGGLGEAMPLVGLQGHRAGRRALSTGVSLTPSKSEPYWACPEGVCEAIVDPPAVRVAGHWALPDGARALEGGGVNGGYDPKDLQSAYDIHTSGGERQERYEEGQTVAVVEAGDDPTAEADLEEYRKQYELGPCTAASGCFRKVNEVGEEDEPPLPDEGWELETSLDLDMVSAACPHCHILLAEASEESIGDLAASANTAARLGASEISNSYGQPEEDCEDACRQYDADYDHPGVVVAVSAGDYGYDNYLEGADSPSFPASSPYVIAVGGTSLHRVEATKGRKWSEAVWWEGESGVGTGSGCSGSEPKPVWQSDTGCAGRTDNDVAAVGSCETPVSVYSTYYSGWVNVCGTSVSSPLVAGIEAHAGEGQGTAVPTADAFYEDKSSLYDVAKGSNGICKPKYLCDAEAQTHGYDGPAGNGTPANGPVAVAGEAPSVRSEPPAGGKTLRGVVDPNGLATTYCFEYGTTISYGTCVPAGEASAGSGTGAVSVSDALTGVPPGLYHYRLVASNRDGSNYGVDELFDATPPTVSGVAPGSGWNVGGTQVTIAGANFVGVAAVRFGSTEASSFRVLSETEIEATSPAGAGSVDVTVENAGGTSATGEADRFSYQMLPPPTVTGVAPSAGLSTGASEVTITGADFVGVSAVDFGSTPATSFAVISETEIEAISPTGTGTVDVTVTTPGGTSATGASDEFTYEAESPAGAAAWLSPANVAEDVAPSGFPDPGVAVDRYGDAAAVWKACSAKCDSEDEFVEASFRPAGGSWGTPVHLSAAAGASGAPQIAFDQHGDAVAVFASYSYQGTSEVPAEGEVVQAAFRPAGGSWQKPVSLSSGCELSGWNAEPHLAVDPAGDALASWRCHVAGTKRILAQAAYMPAGGNWQSPVTLAEAIQEHGEQALSSPNVVIDSHGDAFAGWSHNGLSGESEVAYMPVGGSWQAPTEISEDGGPPELAVDGQGDAYALVEPGGGLAIAYRPSGGSWQAPVEIVPRDSEGGGPYSPDLAVDSRGDALVVWWQYKSAWQYIRAAYKPAGDGWQAPITLAGKTCYASWFCSPEPRVAFDEEGDAVAIWQGLGAHARRLPAGGAWQAPVNISGGESASYSRLALDPDGNGAAVWASEGNGSWAIQAVGYDAAGPQLEALSIPTVGAVGQPVSFSVSPAGVWSTLGETRWTFGDGSSSSGTSAVHTYTAAGSYEVTVESEDALGRRSHATGTIEVVPAPPTVSKLEPDHGPLSGGTPVIVTGEHLQGATAVSFGSTSATSFNVESETEIEAVSPAGAGTVDVTVSTPEGASATDSADQFTYQAAPTVITGAASSFGQASATLNATVNPEGLAVSDCHFEYGSTPSYGASVPCSAPPGSGTTPVQVSAPASGLSPNATYYFRIVATNADGSSYGSEQRFETLPNPPTVVTGAASSLGQRSATLNATVNPNEGAVSYCRFEYGHSPHYGSSVPCSALPGSGAAPVPVSAPVSGLVAYTTYYFRIVAGNAGGAGYGSAQTFEPSPQLPELGRCLKLGTATGKYDTGACTTMSAGEDTGRYEWQPWPAAKDRFSAKGGAATFETTEANKTSVKCREHVLAGEYTGSQSASVSLTFMGCEASLARGPCQSAGASAGEIESGALEGKLGLIEAAAKPSAGWDLRTVAEAPVATFTCGEAAVSVTGSVIAPVTKLDKMTTSFELNYKVAKGEQRPEAFEAGWRETLNLLGAWGTAPAGLTMSDTISGEEPIEIKAIT